MEVAVPGLDLGEVLAQADDHACHAAIAHQQVRADADDRNRHVAGQAGDELREVVAIGGAKHDLRRAAGAKPGDAGERRIHAQPSAYLGQTFHKRQGAGLGHDHRAAFAAGRRSLASSSGSAWAHWVMLPAPRQTTRSPGEARALMMPASAAGSVSAVTWRWPCPIRPATSASLFTPSMGASPAA